MKILWWSAGVSSTVAGLLGGAGMLDHAYYIDIADHHPDNQRFKNEVEFLLGPIETLQSSRYKSVEECCLAASYINGPAGAPCTVRLKKNVRKDWEKQNPGRHTYIWGMDKEESNRAERLVAAMPEHDHVFPLIERGWSKNEVHGYFETLGITRPEMYRLGFPNNNCIGCVKGGKGYWNLIRTIFPEVFKARAAMERRIGASCINGTYLDELDPNAGRNKIIVPDCGEQCEINQEVNYLD